MTSELRFYLIAMSMILRLFAALVNCNTSRIFAAPYGSNLRNMRNHFVGIGIKE